MVMHQAATWPGVTRAVTSPFRAQLSVFPLRSGAAAWCGLALMHRDLGSKTYGFSRQLLADAALSHIWQVGGKPSAI
jgi:hypothetical protein